MFCTPHRGTRNRQKLYNRHTSAERCFSRQKKKTGLETGLRVRSIKKVETHAYLCAITMIAAVLPLAELVVLF